MRKTDLNAIYISERVQETLRPVSVSALTAVVAPMGYGKTTAVNWFLNQRRQTEAAVILRVNIYSDNRFIFWKSVQNAFAAAGLTALAGCEYPEDASSAAQLMDDLCAVLAGDTPCYLFLDDFHLLKDEKAAKFLCGLANRLPANIHLIVASRNNFLPKEEILRLGHRLHRIGREQLRLNHTELAHYAHRCGMDLTEAQVESLLRSCEGWFSAIYLNLHSLAERGILLSEDADIYSMFTAAMLENLPSQKREFLAIMGLADEFTVEMARVVTEMPDAEEILLTLTEQNAFVTRLPDGKTFRFHHMLKECAVRLFARLAPEKQDACRERYGAWYEAKQQYIHAAPLCHSGTDALYVQLAADPQNDGAEAASADHGGRASGVVSGRKRQPSWRVRPDPELSHVQRYLCHEPPAPQRQCADVPPGYQHPEQRWVDLRLSLGADDVPPSARSAGPGAGGDG